MSSWDKDKAPLEKARYFLDGWLEAYEERAIDFEPYCRNVFRVLEKCGVDDLSLELGVAVKKALSKVSQDKRDSIPSKRGRRFTPTWLQKTCFNYVNFAAAFDGFPKSKETRKGMTAFADVADELKSYGINLSAVSVLKYWEAESQRDLK